MLQLRRRAGKPHLLFSFVALALLTGGCDATTPAPGPNPSVPVASLTVPAPPATNGRSLDLPRSVHADGLLTGASVGGGGPVDTGASTVVDVANLVIADIEGFWSEHWTTAFPGVAFQGPSAYGLYESGQIPDFACASSTDDPRTYASNAFYCPADLSIVFESGWFEALWTEHGDFGPAILLAHEWGHHVQTLLGETQDPVFSIQAELQADCFAGVWARHAGESGAFPVDATDIDEAVATLYSIGNEAQFGWFGPGEHGTPSERVNAFNVGYGSTTASACSELANYRMNQIVELDPYVVGLLDGETAATHPTNVSISGINYADVQVQLTNVSVPSGTDAATTLADSLRFWAPDADAAHGSSLFPYHAIEDLTTFSQHARVPGTSIGFSYSQVLDGQQVHGYYFHHNTGSGAGLVVDVFRPGDPPLDKADWTDLATLVWRMIFSFQLR